MLLNDLQRTHAKDPQFERALVMALVGAWAEFRGSWTDGSLLATPPDRAETEKQLQAAFDPIEGITDQASDDRAARRR